jgi:DNA-binding response OmpR family regulator
MLKPMATLLIVEDDALLLDALSGQLQQLDYGVVTAGSVTEATTLLQSQAVDGIILDLGLPGADGMELLTWTRGHIIGLPVLILTARDGVDDRVRGLNAGADDYLTKPFNMQELQARLQAMLRRARQPAFTQASTAGAPSGTTIGPLVLDHVAHAASLNGEPLELTLREWELRRSGDARRRAGRLARQPARAGPGRHVPAQLQCAGGLRAPLAQEA